VRHGSKRSRLADTRVTVVSVTMARQITFMPPARMGAATGTNGRRAPIAGSRETMTRPAWLCMSRVTASAEGTHALAGRSDAPGCDAAPAGESV
jgi:hypothetical protein